jgi:hypothetical protein
MNRPNSVIEIVSYAVDLIQQNLYFAAFCVLQTIRTDHLWNTPNVQHLLCLCGIGMMDIDLIREHKALCMEARLRQLCDALCDEDHDAVVQEFRMAVSLARQAAVPATEPAGIIIPAGGSELLTQLVINIKSLRNTGCTLPVTVAHANELTKEHIDYLQSNYGTQFLNVSTVMPPGNWRGFQIKLASLANTIYDVCILSDADILWVTNPEHLIERMQYERADMLLFRDFWHFRTKPHNKTMATAWLYAQHGLVADDHETESGVVVLRASNRRMRAALRYVATHFEYFFKLTFGDKDLYKLAAHVAGARLTMMPVPRLLCFQSARESATFIGHSMLQPTANDTTSHIHMTLFPLRRGSQEHPLPSHTCSSVAVKFITMQDSGKATQTVGCDTDDAHELRTDSSVSHVLKASAAAASQLSTPW